MRVKVTCSIALEDGETPAKLARMCRNTDIADCPIYEVAHLSVNEFCPIMGDKYCQYITAGDWRKVLKQGEFTL